jgi:predicted transcriptional regulator
MREMYPQCEAVGRYILPILRSLVAKELIEKYNLTQIEAARKLGTTQAAISQYLHSKRGCKGIADFEEILPLIQTAASETAEGIASGKMGADEIASNFCKLCASLWEKGKIPR